MLLILFYCWVQHKAIYFYEFIRTFILIHLHYRYGFRTIRRFAGCMIVILLQTFLNYNLYLYST